MQKKRNEIVTHRLPTLICPTQSCGKALDAHTGGANKPEPGDLSICAYCIGWLRYDEELNLREVTDEDLAELSDEEFKWLLRMAAFAEQRARERGKLK